MYEQQQKQQQQQNNKNRVDEIDIWHKMGIWGFMNAYIFPIMYD